MNKSHVQNIKSTKHCLEKIKITIIFVKAFNHKGQFEEGL